MNKDNQNKFNTLRKEFDTFVFESFDYTIVRTEIKIQYCFQLGDDIKFRPEIKIPQNKFINDISDINYLESLIFNIGLIELISYWKAACPPRIIIKPFKLSDSQIKFWRKIYFNGLGEFFYLNGIKTSIDDFVTIESTSEHLSKKIDLNLDDRKVIVPVGGGKDSIVTLELLKKQFSVLPFILNPRKASIDSANLAGFNDDEILIVHRKIDPQLLILNKKGFLNGHTPFSALLGFVTVLMAALTNSKYIALSNESSANEPTVASGENHQYSKSYEFESDFRNYIQQNLSSGIEYFSFLRPLSEYQIAKLFAGFKHQHSSFRSCNAGSKANSWCCNCSKCLFTNIILSPFLQKEERVKIFGKDLFDDKELMVYLKELTGINPDKPFECVGTVDEVNASLVIVINKEEGKLPVLLDYYKSTNLYMRYCNSNVVKDLVKIDPINFLNPDFFTLLKAAFDD